MSASPEGELSACQFSKGYVAHTYTVLQAQVRSTAASFLLVETELGMTLAGIASHSENPRRLAEAALTACQTVIRYRGRVSLTDDETQEITMKLAELKSQLEQLGQSL